MSGLTCDALVTALLLIGGRVGRNKLDEGMQVMLPAFPPCQELTNWFKPMYKSTVCSEISGVNWFDMNEVATHFLCSKAMEAHGKMRPASGAHVIQGSGDTEPAIVVCASPLKGKTLRNSGALIPLSSMY